MLCKGWFSLAHKHKHKNSENTKHTQAQNRQYTAAILAPKASRDVGTFLLEQKPVLHKRASNYLSFEPRPTSLNPRTFPPVPGSCSMSLKLYLSYYMVRSFRYKVVSLQVDSLHLKSVRYTSKVIYKNRGHREINHMKENVFQNENSRKFVSESFSLVCFCYLYL